jgi:hypothetical protein
VNLKFKQVERDSTLESLNGLLGAIVQTKTSQYEIESDAPINEKFFKEQENYKAFFRTFVDCANPHWVDIWDFSKVPFRHPSEKITGLIASLRSGGAYTQDRSVEEAEQIEEEFRFRFKGIYPDLIIFNMVDYNYSDRFTKSYGINTDQYSELKRISPWFFQVAWDNLIFILNLGSRMMYVVAFTDED